MDDADLLPAVEVARVADRLFDSIVAGDVDGVTAIIADDVLVRHTGDSSDQTKAQAVAVIEWFIATTTERRYADVRRQVFPGGFVQQHSLQATVKTGARLDARVCIVVLVGRDRHICRIDEYFDMADMAPLLS